MTTHQTIEETIKQEFNPISDKINIIDKNINTNIQLKDILSYIDQGIEIAGWFKDFLFINKSKNGFMIVKIHYGVDLDAQFTMINMENSGYNIIYNKTIQELGNLVSLIEHEYNQIVDMYVYTKDELNDMSNEIINETKHNPLELSTIIMKGCDDFWIQLFLEGKIYRTDYDSIRGKIIKEKYINRWNFDIRELATHKKLDLCIDHMLTWFGA